MGLKGRLILPIILFISMILLTFWITMASLSSQKDDGLLINLAGRQRMLSQKMSKELLLFIHASKNQKSEKKETVENSAKVFDLTLKALKNSGEAPLSLNLEQSEYRYCPKAEKEVYRQLEVVEKIWQEFSDNIETILSDNGDNKEAIIFILENNMSLLKEMNRAVVLMQEITEKKLMALLHKQLIIIAIVLIISLFTIHNSLSVHHRLSSIIEALEKGSHELTQASHLVASSSHELTLSTGESLDEIHSITPLLTDIIEIAQKSRAEAIEADLVTDDTNRSTQQSMNNMEEMEEVIKNIKKSSDDTASIIKTINTGKRIWR